MEKAFEICITIRFKPTLTNINYIKVTKASESNPNILAINITVSLTVKEICRKALGKITEKIYILQFTTGISKIFA